MSKKYEDGVWRTVGGRRIFIRDGEDLSSAMKRSGKFNHDDEYDRAHGIYKKEEDEIKERNKRLHREEIERENEERLKRLEEKLKEKSEPKTYFEGKKDIEGEARQIYAEEGIRATSDANIKYFAEKYGIPKTQAKQFIEDVAKKMDEEYKKRNRK